MTLTTVDGLAQLSFVVQGALERRAADHGVTMAQTRLLGVLRDRTPTMNELAELLGLDKSSVSGLVDRAERRGFVARRPSPSDRRVVEVELTAAGRRLVNKVAARFDRDMTELLGELTAPERAALTDLISRVLVAHATKRGFEL